MRSNLKEQCKERLKVAFDSVRATSGSMSFILVVDNYGLKVLSNTIKMMELINFGITSVERLELKRKQFHKIEAVYLIDPSSFQLLLEDYPEEQEPQYKSIHVLSLSKIPISTMQKISKNSSFVKRVKTLKEIHMSFSLHNFNEVKICQSNTQSFGKTLCFDKANSKSSLIKQTVEELATTVTAMATFYIIEIYYQKSAFAEKVASELKEKLEQVFKSYEKYGTENYNSSAPVTVILIFDRNVDAVSPLVRDFHYLPLFYDLKDIKNHKLVDYGKEKKTISLNQNDEIMDKYKNAHIMMTLKGLPQDFQQFSQGHVSAKYQKQHEQLNMNQMSEILKKMPKYMQSKDKYALHIQTLELVLDYFEKNKIKNQGLLEQSILTLTSEEGKKLKEKDLVTDLMSAVSTTKNDVQKAKLVLIGLLCLQLKPKQKSTLMESLEKTSYRHINKSIEALANTGVCRLNPKKTAKNQELLNNHMPKIQQIVKDLANGNQTDLKFLRVGADSKSTKAAVKNQNNLGRKKIVIETDKKDKSRMIVFMSSAMGYNEIRSLCELENTYHMIYASHNFVTPTQYLDLLSSIGGAEDNDQL